MCMPSAPRGPSPEMIRQQQQQAARQEKLMQQQLAESQASREVMEKANKIGQERADAAMAKAEERRKEAEENQAVLKARSEAVRMKAERAASDPTRGRQGLKIDKSANQRVPTFSMNPIDSLVNLPA